MSSVTSLVNKEPPILKVTKKVGLISDTHIPKLAAVMPKSIFEIFKKVDYIVHAGDLVEMALIDELESLAPVLAVHGNMDCYDTTKCLPNLNTLKVFHWKIGVMHDPDITYGFKKMRELVAEHGFDVFIYGHTHEASIKWEGKTLYVNPGSPTVPVTTLSKLTVGMLKITEDVIIPEIVAIDQS